MDGFSAVINAEKLVRLLNASHTFDQDQKRFKIADSSVQELFDQGISNAAESGNQSVPYDGNKDISQKA